MADMTFRQALNLGRPLLLDGAMGTMLQASGLPVGMSPEQYCMESPQALRGIHKAYLDAGADLLTTCTFGGNSFKLPKNIDVFSFNKSMAEGGGGGRRGRGPGGGGGGGGWGGRGGG
ncbi:homocysteine S-methyltransferase family protein, partial [uncultured Desulfovibrio sp.]|uniref:homocysteine S-methyltransferase family protein n=1 Tax=uncultured Desulfovibrio sp. TaxID=167968 RepID=UPI00260C9C04